MQTDDFPATELFIDEAPLAREGIVNRRNNNI